MSAMHVNRRLLLSGAAGGLAAWAAGGGRLDAAEPKPALRVVKLLSAPLTHSDWMLKQGIAWGPEGVRHMLDACKAAGWTRIHWRTLDGGRSLYHSKLMDPQGKWENDNFFRPASAEDVRLVEQKYGQPSAARRAEILARIERYDYGTFDTLAEAVSYGHRIGLEIYAWISVNEDDHGWGIRSRFVKQHPEFCWRKRSGAAYRSQLSFAYPEVMRYKLSVVQEILDRYPVDGLLIDWLRTGDIRDNPQTDADGVADHGYERPLLDGFQKKYGVDALKIPNGDPRWVQFRAEPHTEFMRGVRALARGKQPAGVPIAALVAHPWCYRGAQDRIHGNLRGMLLDLGAWAREGLVDEVVPAGYYMAGGTPEMAYRAVREETLGKVDVVLYCWVPGGEADFLANLALADRVGAKHILFWEADYIDDRANREALQRLMRAHSRGAR